VTCRDRNPFGAAVDEVATETVPSPSRGAGARRSAVVFMAFDLGRYINGRTLVIERGKTPRDPLPPALSRDAAPVGRSSTYWSLPLTADRGAFET
jgi:hypothetical protein